MKMVHAEKEYEITKGVVRPAGRDIEIRGGERFSEIKEAGKYWVDMAKKAKIDPNNTDRVVYGGYFVPRPVAEEACRQTAELNQAKAAALEAAVPGLEGMRAAVSAYLDDADRFSEQFERMMDDERNDGANPPAAPDPSLKERVDALTEQYPRAALYVRAERQDRSAHWADNTGKGAAAKECMRLLAAGASTEEAEAALAQRRDFVD